MTSKILILQRKDSEKEGKYSVLFTQVLVLEQY